MASSLCPEDACPAQIPLSAGASWRCCNSTCSRRRLALAFSCDLCHDLGQLGIDQRLLGQGARLFMSLGLDCGVSRLELRLGARQLDGCVVRSPCRACPG